MSLRFFRAVRTSLLLTFLVSLLSPTGFAQDESFPKIDVFGGYSWMEPGSNVGPIQLNSITKGFGVAATYNLYRNVGFTVDGGGHFGDIADIGTIMVGPRFMFRTEGFEPFVHGMFGLHRMDLSGVGTDNGIGLRAGGGFDLPINNFLSWRVLQADYVWAHHNFDAPGDKANLAGAELRSGLVFRFGGGPPPPPLAASCAAQPTQVMAGQPVTVTVSASNIRQGHTVEYEFRSTGGQVQPQDNTARVDTTGLAPGSYNVTATVTDRRLKEGGTANCSASFTIQEPPRHPPTISCSASRATVQAGEPVTITCTGQSPDNRPLTYNWRTSGGRLTPQQNQANLDTSGVPAGTITVTTTVTDDRGLSANTTTTVNVEVPPPPPQASRLNEIQFRDTRRPARVDNEAKAILDDVALRLQREPDARAVIVGQYETSERNGQQIAQQRAVNTKAYLVQEKGIDGSRLEVRTGDAGTRTAEIWIVPQGATFEQAGTVTFDESSVGR
jgi:outer membrane protein OmpA-like peptidoglycan-associated protein